MFTFLFFAEKIKHLKNMRVELSSNFKGIICDTGYYNLLHAHLFHLIAFNLQYLLFQNSYFTTNN